MQQLLLQDLEKAILAERKVAASIGVWEQKVRDMGRRLEILQDEMRMFQTQIRNMRSASARIVSLEAYAEVLLLMGATQEQCAVAAGQITSFKSGLTNDQASLAALRAQIQQFSQILARDGKVIAFRKPNDDR